MGASISAAVAALVLCASTAQAGAYHVLGAGVGSYDSYLNYRTIPDADAATSSSLEWVEGYLTAYNKLVARGGDVLAGQMEVKSLQDWLDTYCRAHPSDEIVTAAQSLIAELKAHKH